MAATKNKKNKEGRHVGLDFYDLLIEVLTDPVVSLNAEQLAIRFRTPR